MAWTRAQSATKDKNGVLVRLEEIVGGVNQKILNFSDIDQGHRFEILSLRLTLTSTATVGVRTPVIELEDAAGAILLSRVGASRTVAASSALTLQFGQGLNVAEADHESRAQIRGARKEWEESRERGVGLAPILSPPRASSCRVRTSPSSSPFPDSLPEVSPLAPREDRPPG